jgi:hypothetical protein
VLYPVLAERDFDGTVWTSYTRSIHLAAPIAVVLYLAMLWLLPQYMATRAPIRLKRSSAVWNLGLAVFSFIGVARLLPTLVHELVVYGPIYTICRQASVAYGCRASGLWTMLFIYSKFVELGDTVFLILAKKHVNFLHWFHHCTVLLFTWSSYCDETPNGQYFITMNYAVHSVMYFYYFLTCLGYRPPWAMAVTIAQISQMAVGIAVIVYAYFAYTTVPNCAVVPRNLVWGCTMYACYFALFVQFFVQRYSSKPKTAGEKKQQ